jgi:ElaB/YqjD/DUF883 family membrane-anchored ribosome-binding protein
MDKTPKYNKEMNNKIQKIEQEINSLTQRRTELFNEWIYLVKKNDREDEIYGKVNSLSLQKADELLKEQRLISKKIMKLMETADNLIAD